ncbi:DUF3883 domain-containing protein [Methylotuvimicrobium sp. KM1]|uniref:DUF3883 domain-containing protein n=1 Tax=Methylotuvimicrobium sp. KM1 TaxID=3377707 RepID=UPI00384ED27E
MTIGREFGQHEPLTTRLHNLVRSYPKGLGVLKEFIQNADDAEADEVMFVIDEQEYDVTGLPDSMRWLHTTPALLVYNNKPFSDRDIEGIQNIGESGKSRSVGKTGRFGLGFNGCYNVTDVPCFFTRGELYFFDPHFHTVPEASMVNPGRSFSVDELIDEGWPILDSLASFIVDESNFEGTVFRLPFRSCQQATTSRIKREEYTVADALEAVQELEQMGSAMLLFLKYVRHLKVEHRKRDGSVLCLLSIQATNSDEIVSARAKVNALLYSANPDYIVDKLSEMGSIFSNCRHEYKVVANGVQRTEKWRVIDGFFVDEEQKVISTCREMLEKDEKALPYAGTAWPLDNNPQMTGRIFCFLPIPMQTSMPVQVNGYFDLDDSRQNIFLDWSTHGTSRLRVDWNQILLETSVTLAYIQLIEELRSDLEIVGIDSYYRAFPQAVTNEGNWEHWLTIAFYQRAATAPIISVSGEFPWLELSETRSLPEELMPLGDLLISEQFLPIQQPQMPIHVVNGFAVCGIQTTTLKPSELRTQLMVRQDIDTPLNLAPRACLQKREYIEQIFRFCLKDQPGETIAGLPLVIDCRGHLRTVGFTELPLYLANTSLDLEVFWDHQEWFVDMEFANYVGLSASDGINVLDMNDECFVRELEKYVSTHSKNGQLKMIRSSAGTLTDSWLRAVFKRLLDSELRGLKDEIKSIPLIPDQQGELHKMGSAATPLLFQGAKELRNALNELNIPLVHGVSSELFQLISEFSRKEDCIWYVTPRDLIDTLDCVCNEILQSYDRLTDIQRALLDYLSKEECIVELQKCSDRQDTLRTLKIFPSGTGLLVDLKTTAYIPQEFTFPALDLDVMLLDDGPKHRWRDLLLLLNVPELSRSRLIRELLLPSFNSLNAADRISATAWLRDNLSIAQSDDEKETEGRLFAEVQEAPIIICDDQTLRPPQNVYQPDSKLAADILGNQASFPDMTGAYAQNKERWLEFFRQLNMPIEPRIKDVVSYVQTLVNETPKKETVDRLQTVYEFIKERVDSDLKHHKELTDELSEAIDELSMIAWIPLRNEAGDLLCFSAPTESYGYPSNIYFPRVGQLVASQAQITVFRSEPSKQVREVMGFPIKPPLDLVVNHFEEILAQYAHVEKMPNKSALIKSLSQIYRFFGGEIPKEVDDTDEVIRDSDSDRILNLEAKFFSKACIWDQEQMRFWRPDRVFSDDVRYMEPWRTTIRNSEDAVERGYAALGRRQSASISDWKQVLHEISESESNVSQSKISHVVREIIRHIVNYLDYEDIEDDEVLVPTRSGSLLAAKAVYLADAPWYEEILDSREIPILSDSVSGIPYIQSRLKISSLAASIKQRLTEYPTESVLEQESAQCFRFQSLLRSDEFVSGLQRLLKHEGFEVSNRSLIFLKEVEVQCVKSIQTCLYLVTEDSEQLIGDSKAEFYLDEDQMVAMLAEYRRKYFRDDLADLLNRMLKDSSLRNLAPLVRILECCPDEISETLDALKIRKYAFDIDDEPKKRDEIAPQEFPDYESGEIEIRDEEKLHESETPDLVVDMDLAVIEEDEEQCGTTSNATASTSGSNYPHATSTSARPQSSTVGHFKDATTGAHQLEENGNNGKIRSGIPDTGSGHRQYLDMEKEDTVDGRLQPVQTSTISTHQPSVQRRLVSYVSHTNTNKLSDRSSSVSNERELRTGEIAVELVIEYERSQGRDARSMAHQNAGYDVMAEGADGKRYIEVKGTEAAWGERGVSMTAAQFFYARENPDRDHWLYVVESVRSSSPKIHKIHNPSNEVDRFVFDGGWKQIADSNDAKVLETVQPAPGDEVYLNGIFVGIVETIRPFGKFPLVLYRDSNDVLQRKRLADITVRSRQA